MRFIRIQNENIREAVLTLRDMTSDAIGTCHYAP